MSKMRTLRPLMIAVRFTAMTYCTISSAASLPMLPSSKNAGHLQITRSHTFMVPLPMAETFTLFEPVPEKTWAKGFDPVFASSESANLGADSVFTHEESQGGAKHQSIWLITRYDRAAAIIEYRAVYPALRVAHIMVQCRESAQTGTSVEVTYHYTGLSEDGDHYIASMTDKKFAEFIEGWASAIRECLARGTHAMP